MTISDEVSPLDAVNETVNDCPVPAAMSSPLPLAESDSCDPVAGMGVAKRASVRFIPSELVTFTSESAVAPPTAPTIFAAKESRT